MSLLNAFKHTQSPIPVQPVDKLTELREQLTEAELEHTRAQDEYFSQMQNVRLEPPVYFRAASERSAARVRHLRSAVAALEQEHGRMDAAARRSASIAFLPEYKRLIRRVVAALRELRAALAGLRDFRERLDKTNAYDATILEPFCFDELGDDDRLAGTAQVLEEFCQSHKE
jgi:hypothetical protein